MLNDARRRGILGAALAAGGRDLEATPLLERALAADPKRSHVWEPLLALCEGRHLRSIGHHEDAIVRLARALDAGGLWGEEAKTLLDAYWASARDHGDLALARVLGSTYPEPSPDPALEAVRLSGVAQELIVRQEWGGARAVLERIELAGFSTPTRVLIISDLALATALTGDVDRAVHVAAEAVKNAHVLPDVEKRATVHGIYAVALSLAQRHEEALAMFAALRTHGTPRERSLLCYFEGESLLQLGCTIDARIAYVNAMAVDNHWARLARDMIEAIDASAFGGFAASA
jgi:tetratricopeptide (TPR) repeat protein